MDQNKSTSIKITGKLNYEDEITLNQAAQIIAFIDTSSSMDVTTPAAATRLVAMQSTTTGGRVTTNPREALENSGAKTNPEKIVAFASIMLDEGQKTTFTLEDVKPLFRRAREATPKNLSRDLDKAIQNGWVDEADDKGEYYLTAKALTALEAGFTTDQSKRSSGGSRRSAAPRKSTRKAIEVPEAFKKLDSVPNTLDGYPAYSSLKLQKDRLIWALVLAKTLGVQSLSNQEAVWLTDQLGAAIVVNNMGAAYASARKPGYVNRSLQDGKMRLVLPQADDYLKTLDS